MSSSALSAGLRNLRSRLAVHERREDSDEQLLHAFTSRRDDSAFAALVRRHGPMVLHVCRRVLGHEQDAEDAFQATFLVLAQSAAKLRNKSMLASFLHGIAYRTAMKAKQSAARRRKHEGSVGALMQPRSPGDPADESSWREVRALLDEEINCLPEKYRIVFVLFHLEDLSREETARWLGLKDFTVANRLTEARKRLRQRLARRGVELTVVLAAMGSAAPVASALPPVLTATTIKAALAMTTGEKLAGLVSASVANLSQGAATAMMVSKTKMAALILLAVTLLGGASAWFAESRMEKEPGQRRGVSPPVSPPTGGLTPRRSPQAVETLEIRGRVFGPDGKPKAGAKLLLLGENKKIAEVGITASDGRFAILAPKETKSGYLIAQAEGFGIDFLELSKSDPKKPIELRLVKDLPIRGRIVNTEGKPLPKVRVSVDNLGVYRNNSLDSFLAVWKKQQRLTSGTPNGEKNIGEEAGALLFSTTDADGRFIISQIGDERFVSLRLGGGGIADVEVWIANRRGFDPKPYNQAVLNNSTPFERKISPDWQRLHGSELSLVVEAGKTIRGIVKDADSGKGRPGVEVILSKDGDGNLVSPLVKARTDQHGRFEILGARKRKSHMLEVLSDTAAGYLRCQIIVADTSGYQPIAADIGVKKGIIIAGKVIDKATGKSIPGWVHVGFLKENPFVKDYPTFSSSAWIDSPLTNDDGIFRVVAVPGPVLLMGGPDQQRLSDKSAGHLKYKLVEPDPNYPRYFSKKGQQTSLGVPYVYYSYDGQIRPLSGNFCKVLEIKPDAKVVEQDIVLERAFALPVHIQDADGKSLSEVWIAGVSPDDWHYPIQCRKSECSAYHLERGKPRLLVFFHPGRKLTGAASSAKPKTPRRRFRSRRASAEISVGSGSEGFANRRTAGVSRLVEPTSRLTPTVRQGERKKLAEAASVGNYYRVITVSESEVAVMSSSPLAAGLRHLRGKLAAQERHEDSDEQLLHDFTSRRDDNAFAVLVHRHGPMVLHVCRRVLGHEQDAEDAFQATFLVLARHAAALRNKTRLASFLHGTAYRIAMKAKQTAARRRKHEGSVEALAQPRSTADPADEVSWREVRALLDEEIARLPEIYRIVFVICCLENASQVEAAQRLGLKERTVSNRLAEARKRLAKRLARRGVELTAVLAAADVATPVSALPVELMASTIEASLAMAAGEKWAGMVSASVAKLVKGTTAAMMAGKAKMATAILLVVTLLGGAGAWVAESRTDNEPGERRGVSPPVGDRTGGPTPRRSPQTLEIQGRVLDPDGKPKAGAKLLLHSEDSKLQNLGVSASDGRFSVAVPKKKGHHHLIAQSDGAGMDFIDLESWQPGKSIELRLVKENALRGRVVNTEGKPIVGVGVSVHEVHVYPHNSLESFLTSWQKRLADYALPYGEKYLRFQTAALLTAETDADGRFAISGIGGERVAVLHLQGAGIANAALWIVNRAGFDPKPYNRPVDDAYLIAPKMMNPPSVGMALRGPNVAFVAEPEKPIRGTVKDADSGKGMPSVLVHLHQGRSIPPAPPVEARTDARGRFEFRGARKTKTYQVSIASDSSSGYLAAQVNAADTVGFAPLTVDLRIKKGAIVTGKIIDRATGKSVPGFAQIEVLANNPLVKDYPPLGPGFGSRQDTAADGTFRVVAIAGPVLLMGGYYPPRSAKFDYIDFSKYRPAVADPKYPQYFSSGPGSRRGFHGYLGYGGGIGIIQGNYCKVLEIKPGTAVVHQDLILERASILEVKIQDAEGRPVVGVWASDFASQPYIGPLEIEESTCPVYGLEARKPRMLIFYEPKRKIIGSRKLQGDEKQPLTVTLGPMASLKGRLLDADGKPLAGVAINVLHRESEAAKLHRDIHDVKQSGITDVQGAFAIHELIPELAFQLSFQHGKRRFERESKAAETTIRIKPGECRDLGAIKVIRGPE